MRIQVGDWTVEPEKDRIVRNGEERLLRPQVMDILTYLAGRPGKTISNEELMDQLWSGKIVTSGTLYNAVNELRQALGDDAQAPRYIKTVPKRGYCLIAEARSPRPSGREEFSSILEQARSEAAAHPDRRLNWAGATVILAILAVLAWVMILPFSDRFAGERARTFGTPGKSVAVLPFDDMSAEGDQAYFADGLSEEILNRLAQQPGLKVTGRISSFALRDTKASFSQVGQLLGVAHLLEGSVRKEGDNVRVTAQLINAQDGFHVWSKVYERRLTELFQVQDEIAGDIVSALELSLAPEASDSGALVPPAFRPGLEAHDYYLRAREGIRQQTKDSLLAAVDELETALELEPEYAAAHVEMARALIALLEYVGWHTEDAEWKDVPVRARSHIDAALAKDPRMASAWAVLGYYYISAETDENEADPIQLAEDALRTALNLNPLDSEAHFNMVGIYGNSLVSWAAPIEHLEKAVEIDPLWPEPATELALRLSLLPHRVYQSEAIFDRLLEIYPDRPRLHHWYSYWLKAEGRLADAVRAAEASMRQDPDFAFGMRTLKILWYQLGEPRRAAQLDTYPVSWIVVLAEDRAAALDELTKFESGFDNDAQSFDGWRPWVAYSYLMLDRPEDALRILGYVRDSEELVLPEAFVAIPLTVAPLITMATAFKLLGLKEESEKCIARQLEELGVLSENGSYKNAEYWRVMARTHALRDEDYAALLALQRLTDKGRLDPREMMHPAYDGMRHLPEFQALVERRARMINAQRALLGLDEADMVAYQRAN